MRHLNSSALYIHVYFIYLLLSVSVKLISRQVLSNVFVLLSQNSKGA